MDAPRRSRRFDRSPADGKTVPQIRLTETDIAILQHVYRHRLLSSDAIYRLFPNRSQQQLSRRLHALFLNHYLGRPPRQVELFPPGEGSSPLIYGLDREGAKLLKAQFGLRVQPYHWLQKNNELSRTNIAHTVSTASFMADLHAAVERSGKARIIHLDEIIDQLAPERTKKLPIPERWQVTVDWKGYRGREGTRPDFIFGIEYRNQPEGKNRSFFYLEMDEGTETIEPTIDERQPHLFFRKSSILRKYVVYASSHLTRAHEQHFGLPVAARVLVVTPSPKRIQAMQEVFTRHCRERPLLVPPGLFLFADRLGLGGGAEGLFSRPWLDAEGKERFIDDR